MALSREKELRLRARARRRRQQRQGQRQQQSQGKNAAVRFGQGVAGGMADVAGIVPGAAMEAGNLMGLTDFENTSGGDLIRSGLDDYGITGSPGEDLGLAGEVGEAVGQFGVPGAGATGALARRGASLASSAARAPAQTAGGRMLEQAAEGAARAPTATAASEMSAAAGEPLGRAAVESAGEGEADPWETMTGSLVGGVLGGLGPTAAAAGAGRTLDVASNLPLIGIARRATERLFGLEAGGKVRQRAGERLRSVAEQNLTEGDELAAIPAQQELRGRGADVDSSLLTPAQQSGDPGIMSLAARQRANDPKVLANWRSQVEDNMATLRNRLKNVTGREAAQIEEQLGQNVDDAVIVAAEHARRRLSKMSPDMRRSRSSEVMRNELDQAYREARDQEKALWQDVPEDMVMPAETVRNRYLELQGQLTEENIESMPKKAQQFLDPSSPQSYYSVDADGQTLTDVVPMKRLQALRSALMDEARNARSGPSPDRQRARLSKELADGLLDDMTNVAPQESPGTAAFNAARGFSRHLNDRFTRGVVGDVLQTRARGDANIPPESTLDRTVGRGGVEAERASKSFIQALQSPNDSVRGAFTDFLKDDFQKMAIRDGQLNPAGGMSFMRKYRELFQAQPQLGQQFEQAISDGDLAAVAGMVQDGAARVLSKNNPAAEIRNIKKRTRSDATGAVWASFRRGLTQELLERARVLNPRGDVDREIISGTALKDMLDNEKFGPALRQAYSPDEMKNLRQIANTAQRIERDIGARAAADLVTDEPNAIATLLAQFSGAQMGSAAARGVGGGAGGSLQAANILSNAMRNMVRRGVRDPASSLIERALNDKGVMDALLTPYSQANYQRRVMPRVNAWLGGVMEDVEAETTGFEPPSRQRRARPTSRQPGPQPDLPDPAQQLLQ